MTTSRYAGVNPDVYSSSSTITNQATSASSVSGSRSSQTETVNMDFMSATGRQALDSLLAQLSAGGTTAQRQIQEDILRTIQQIEGQRAQYTKDAAFVDAEGAMQQQLRQALEQTLPSILLAGEAAGTSGDAISALLAQDAGTRAAESSAALGLGAAVDYGNIGANLLAQQSQLVNREDPALAALVEALGIDKGSAQRGTTKTKGSASQSQSSTSNTRQTTVTSGAQSGDASKTNQITVQ